MGSSSIRKVILEGITGPVGSQGPVGSIGSTGPTSGTGGSTGTIGSYVITITSDSNGNPILTTNDAFNFTVYGLTGPTGTNGPLVVSYVGNTGYTLIHSISGGTVYIKGLSFSGLLSSSIVDGSIVITPQDESTNLSVFSGSSPYKVVYAKTESEIASTNINILADGETISFSDIPNGITYTSTFLDSRFTVGNIPEITQENIAKLVTDYANFSPYIVGIDSEKGAYLDLTKTSALVLNTPIGIAGFCLGSALYDTGDLISFTFFVNGSELWSFPDNVYFEDKPESTYFGCGMNILNIWTYNKGSYWFATITDRGYGITGCDDLDSLGSCCYQDDEGNFECDDYRTKGMCDKLNGRFRPATSCAVSCGTTLSTFCCTEGKCVDGISEDECESFGGKFYITDFKIELTDGTTLPLSCEFSNTQGANYAEPILAGRLCYDRCADPVSCCKNGVCIGEMSRIECELLNKGKAVPGVTCGTVDCCKYIPFYGACCSSAGTERLCREDFIYNCNGPDDVFMGHGTQCTNQNICCQTDVEYDGVCCLYNQSCIGTNRLICDALGGVFNEAAQFCDSCSECWDANGDWICGCENPPCGPVPPPCPNGSQPPCDDEPPCTNPPCGNGSRCITVYNRKFCLSCPANNPCPDNQCPPDCGTVIPPPPQCENPPCEPPIIVPPIVIIGGGGGPPPQRDLAICPDCTRCKCPQFPINGYLFTQIGELLETVGGASGDIVSRQCVCFNMGPDPETANYPCPDDAKWRFLDTGQIGTAPPYINACCVDSPDPNIPPACNNSENVYSLCCGNSACYCQDVEDPTPCSGLVCCSTCDCPPPTGGDGTIEPAIPVIRYLPDGNGGCEKKCLCLQPCEPSIGEPDPCSSSASLACVAGPRVAIQGCPVGFVSSPFPGTSTPPPPFPAVFTRKLKDPTTGIISEYYCDSPYSPCFDPAYEVIGETQ